MIEQLVLDCNKLTQEATEHAIKRALEIVDEKLNGYDIHRVVHGHWAKLYADHQSCGVRPFTFYCSVCHEITAFKHKFCPNCGSQMDEVTE